MPKMIFINLPVTDIAKSTRFYEAIGCVKNEQFSDEKSSSMVWSEAITFQLMTHEYFSTYAAGRSIPEPHRQCGMLFALSQESREAVDAVTQAAADNGGKADIRELQDMGFMYLRTFEDPDGHIFEPAWMNPEAMPGEGGA